MDLRAVVTVMCRLLRMASSMSDESSSRTLLVFFFLAYIMETNSGFWSASSSGAGFLIRHWLVGERSSRNWYRDGLFCKLRLRSFATLDSDKSGINTQLKLPAESISLHRYLIADLRIRERRRCLGLLQSPAKDARSRLPQSDKYIIVRLLDRRKDLPDNFNKEGEATPPCPIRLCQPGIGFAMFQRLIWAELDDWVQDWRDSIEALDRKFAFRVLIPSIVFMWCRFGYISHRETC